MDRYQELTEEFHDNAGIDHAGTKEDQLLWISMLTEELGELADAVNDDRDEEALAEELADIVVVSFGMARICGIDLREAFEDVMATNMEKSGSTHDSGKVVDDADAADD